MKRTIRLLCPAIVIAFGTASFAQNPPTQPTQPPTQSTRPPDQSTQPPVTGRPADPSTGSKHMKMKSMSMTGTVKAYEPGKSLEVTTKSGEKTYDLTASDMTVTVSPDVKVGSKVKVVEKPDANGRKTVSVEAHGSGTH